MSEVSSFLGSIMPLLYVVLALCALFITYVILKQFGVFEVFGVNTSKSTNVIANEKRVQKRRNREKVKLELYSNVCNMFRGVLLPAEKEHKYRYCLERLRKKNVILNRTITPEEYAGRRFCILLISILLCIIGYIFNFLILLVGVAGVIYFVGSPMLMNQKIRDEDAIIDLYFLDLYLLMYSKLRQGSRARLSTVVESYIDTLSTSNDTQMKVVMTNLAEFLLNNLSMYPDHEAVPMLRQRYNSATIVNFCNVATQALQGVDNADTLLTFKMALVEKKSKQMHKRVEKMRKKGERAVMAIYLLLFVFIVISWASKIF